MLRPSQLIRLVGTEKRRDRAVGLRQPFLRGFVKPATPGRTDREDAAGTFDRNVPRLGLGCGYQLDAPGTAQFHLLAHPLGARASFAT